MTQFERIFHLHALFKSARHPLSLLILIQKLEMSKATVQRDIEFLRNMLGAPLEYDRAANGYFYDESAGAFELPGVWFNASELYALLAAEHLLETVQPGLLGPSLAPLKERIRKLLAESGGPAEQRDKRVQIRTVATRVVEPKAFGDIARVVMKATVARIDYHGRGKDEQSERDVHPQRLIHYRGNWYLLAWCESAQDLRLFAVDRIHGIHPLEHPHKALPDDELDRHVNASFGIFAGKANYWAVLRFTPEAARWVAEEVWHPDQLGEWYEGQYELQIPYSDPTELVMDILRYGPDVEVVAPSTLRTRVAEQLERALVRYGAAGASRCEAPGGVQPVSGH